MDKSGGPSFRQCVAAAIVIGGHVLLTALFSSATRRPVHIAESNSQNRSVLFLLELPPPAAKPLAQELKPNRSGNGRAREHPNLHTPVDGAVASLSPDTSADTAIDPSAKPSIDWYLEAERVAREGVAEAMKHEKRKCDPADPPTSLLPKCRKPLPKYEWDPEPKIVGFAGPLPYVRLGKRCIVGLGFFGCAVGKLPEPNTQLLDHMRDPNRSRSSVPDIDESGYPNRR